MKDIDYCINSCLASSLECEACATACILLNSKEYDHCISLCRDCSDICALCARFTSRGSSFRDILSKLCADLCKACEDECRKFLHHDSCRKCAEACGKCAAVCNG